MVHIATISLEPAISSSKFVQNLAATQMCQSQDFLLPLSQFFSQVLNNLNFWEFPNWIEFLSLERQFAVKLYFTYRRFVETARKGKTRSGSISRLSGYFCLPRAVRSFFFIENNSFRCAVVYLREYDSDKKTKTKLKDKHQKERILLCMYFARGNANAELRKNGNAANLASLVTRGICEAFGGSFEGWTSFWHQHY